ncbi:serine/arginine-rich splicing factor RS31-like isoform X3 [Spinacia oleracea]|uniref:Serine/arginine-rich splicing factor RS31-like isoform X3 n=1 Tax=Spinacia oleracea TaxID=3562 RepID=A0ABM3QH57_SPIOL|nr:serine/arginine-rich splicing factor RS31-like isoform X3 [Spinacia oleracea]XP_056682697.1 serine/arginine-rich splicing factor RS31-like isoform X3 [Spinacia oleracea]
MSAIVRIDNVLSTLGSFDFNLGKKSSSGITLLLSLWLLNNQMDFETQNGIEEVAAIIRGNPDYGRDESPANGRYHSRSRLEAQGSPEFVKDESPANGRYHSRSRSEGRGTSYYPKDESPANGRYHSRSPPPRERSRS